VGRRSFSILICIFVIFLIADVNMVSAVNYIYKSWSDSACYDSVTFHNPWGTAKARHGDVDNIGIYTDTKGDIFGIGEAHAWVYIDGGYNNVNPWYFPTQTYIISVHWYVTGTFVYVSPYPPHYTYWSRHFYRYELYHKVGESKVIDISKEVDIKSDFNYDNQLIIHNLGYTTLSQGIAYYLRCEVGFSLTKSFIENDLHDSGNKIDFRYVAFLYLT
jgi:hypothetical protein